MPYQRGQFWVRRFRDAVGEPGIYDEPDVAPDERRLSVKRYNAGKTYEIWILDISTNILSRLTSVASDEAKWSPNSHEIVLRSFEKWKYYVYRKTVGSADPKMSPPIPRLSAIEFDNSRTVSLVGASGRVPGAPTMK